MTSEDFIHTSGDFRETSERLHRDFTETSEEGPETSRFQETSESSVTSIRTLYFNLASSVLCVV